jgi:peroxiredoxin (alkyl hydroperoxide reductase subunit C)
LRTRAAGKRIILEEQVMEVRTMIKAGKPAPNFVAPAYYQGRFTHAELSRYRDQWVVLYFYGGDYTFV